MVFGHAPIILPAVTGRRVRYAAAAYGPLALPHASVLPGMVAESGRGRRVVRVSGLLTILVLVAYAITLAIVSRRGSRRPTPIQVNSAPALQSAGRWRSSCAEQAQVAGSAEEPQGTRRPDKL
jgi:hypothetical protein